MNRPTSDFEITRARTLLYLIGAGTLIALIAIAATLIGGEKRDLEDLAQAPLV